MLALASLSERVDRRIGQGRHGLGLLAQVRALSLLVAVVLVSAGCSARQEIVYVDAPSEDGPGAYTPFGRSGEPRVHADGEHEPSEDVQIGPAHADAGDESYTPFAGSGEPLVHADGTPHVPGTITLANERAEGASHAEAATSSTRSAERAAEKPPTPGASALLKPAPSPTPPTRLALRAGLGAKPGTPTTDSPQAADDDEHRSQAAVMGKVESVVGSTLKLQTQAGPQTVRLASNVRVERDALGTPADLKPGQFVGVAHLPSGPADSVRLYSTGPNMPQPGVAPMVGSRSGQVTTFGSVVTLQFGGLLLNTGSETTTVTLPNGVPILRAAQQAASDLAVGSQVVATGPVGEDGSLMATAVRVTGSAPPAR